MAGPSCGPHTGTWLGREPNRFLCLRVRVAPTQVLPVPSLAPYIAPIPCPHACSTHPMPTWAHVVVACTEPRALTCGGSKACTRAPAQAAMRQPRRAPRRLERGHGHPVQHRLHVARHDGIQLRLVVLAPLAEGAPAPLHTNGMHAQHREDGMGVLPARSCAEPNSLPCPLMRGCSAEAASVVQARPHARVRLSCLLSWPMPCQAG